MYTHNQSVLVIVATLLCSIPAIGMQPQSVKPDTVSWRKICGASRLSNSLEKTMRAEVVIDPSEDLGGVFEHAPQMFNDVRLAYKLQAGAKELLVEPRRLIMYSDRTSNEYVSNYFAPVKSRCPVVTFRENQTPIAATRNGRYLTCLVHGPCENILSLIDTETLRAWHLDIPLIVTATLQVGFQKKNSRVEDTLVVRSMLSEYEWDLNELHNQANNR